MSEWKTTTTAHLIEKGFLKIGDGYRAKNDELTSVGLPFARAGNINNGFLFVDADCLPARYTEIAKDKVSQLGDIVFTSKGTVGRFGFVSHTTPTFVYSPQLCFWRSLDASRIAPRFLYYWMHGVEFLGQVESLKGQTDMADYVNLADQRQMAITLPPLPEQRAIADVLSSLDDKIDLLHRQNKTLESIAETLFRQWFIEEAQPVWEDGFIVDLFILQRGFDLPATQREPGHVPIVAASGHNGVHLHSQVKAPGVVTGRSGVIGSVFYVQEDFWPLNTTLWIKEFKKGTPLYSFYVLKNLDLEAMNAGSAVPTLNRNHVHLIHQKVPPKELMKEFEDIAAVHYKKIHSNQTQIRTLEKLRDSLLPKLMSGEVSIC